MDKVIGQVRHYRRNYSIVARAHYISADKLGSLNAWLGIPAFLLSIAICSTLFASGAQRFPQMLLTVAGIASLAVTLLTGLQVFLRTAERSTEHRAAGARFADIRRRLELMELRFSNSPNDTKRECIAELENMLKELRELGALCPKLPDKSYTRAQNEYVTENESKMGQHVAQEDAAKDRRAT